MFWLVVNYGVNCRNVIYGVYFVDVFNCRIGNEGGEAICKSLINNTSLRVLNLAGNNLSEPTAAVLSHVLKCNCTLKSIIFSGNHIGKVNLMS